MALIPRTPPPADTAATAPAFENPDDTVVQQPATATAATTAPAPTQALATRPTQALAVARNAVNPFAEMENAYEVEYNTLTQLMATNGNFMEKENNIVLGDTIGMLLMSYQDNYVISPGDDSDAAKKLVRYSNDGINTKDGESVSNYLSDLKSAGYVRAYLSKRVILVGALVNPGKATAMQDTLVQIDLAPTSKAMFDRYKIQAAFDIGSGKCSAEASKLLTLTAKVAKNKNNQIYTMVNLVRTA